MPSVLKKILKVFLWIIVSVLILLVGVVLLIRLPSIQNYIVSKVEPMVEEKIGTPFNIDRVYISFPKNVTVEGLYVEDQREDTLLNIGYLDINIGLFGLLSKEIDIGNVVLENTTAKLFKDSTKQKFNFDFIIEAFQSDTSQQQEETSSQWKIDAGGLELRDFRFSYVDQTSLMNVQANLNNFDLDLNQFNLDSLDFGADQFILSGANITVESFGGTEEVSTDTTSERNEESTPLSLRVEELQIKNTSVKYVDSTQSAQAQLSELSLEENFFSLHKQDIHSDLIKLENSFVHYQMFETDTTEASSETDTDTSTTEPWQINVAQIHLKDNEVRFDNGEKSDSTSGIDFTHLHLTDLSTNIQNVSVAGSDIAANIERLQFAEQSGFAVNRFDTHFEKKGEKITVQDLQLETNASSLSASTVFYLTAFMEHETDDDPSLVNIGSATLDPRDLFYFAPQMRESFPINRPLSLQGQVKGWLDDLNINNLTASVDHTTVDLQGHLGGLPQMNEFYFDVQQLSVKSNAKSLKAILPDTLIPATLQVPNELDITANAQGSLNDLQGSLSGVTSMGNFYFEGSFKNDTIEKYLDLNGEFEIEQFDVGQLIGNPQMGKVEANIRVDGAGEDFASANIDVHGIIDLLQYNQYNYEDLKINGNIQGQSYRGKLSSEDENLRFYFDGLVDMTDSIPQLDLRLDLVNADLQALNFVPNQLVVSGVITADITADADGRINGDAGIRKAKIIKEGEFFAIDSIIAVSVSEERKTELTLNSGIFDARLAGNVDITQVGSILKHHFDQYFSEELSTDSTESELQQFEFSLDLQDPTLLTDVLLPSLETLKIAKVEGSFNNIENQFNLEINVPQVVYGSFHLDTMTLNVESDNQRLTAEMNLALLQNAFLHIDDLSLTAASAEDALNLLVTIPLKDKKDFQLGTQLYRKDSAYYLSLQPATLVFNGNAWTAPANNYLKLSPALWFHDFAMENGNKRLVIDSRLTENSDTTLHLSFSNFDLKTLTEPLSDTVSLASGMANGTINLLSQYEGLSLNTDLRVSELTVLNNEFGDLSLTTSYEDGENNFDFSLNGEGADIEATGFLISRDTSTQAGVDADINKLQLSVVYPFVKEYFSKLNGQLSGNLSFETTDAFPEIDGRLKFDNVNLTPTYTGVEVKIDDEQIRINNENVVFNDFRIDAVESGSIVLDGNVKASDFPNYQVTMAVRANNFMVLNTTAEDNELYYGELRISGNADVAGDQDLLNVDASLTVEEGSELTYVVPQQQSSVITSEGLVRYIDIGGDTTPAEYAEARQDTATATVQGIDLAANISINEESTMSIVLDQQTGDRLNVSGNANLTLNMPPAGDMSLTGRYEVSEGSYKLNFYEFVKKEFQIVEGSSILWTGDPLEAELNVTTRYVVETLPPVIEIGRRLPFYVNLMINGEILDPRLSFKLSLPDELQAQYEQVYGFLQDINGQETELNKQVFSLILFNSFMDAGGEGSGDFVSNTARQSLSKILSQQLNKLAGNLNFVELDVNLESYETGGTESSQARTDLELGLSKSLFNDRVTVRVEGNLNLQGEEQTEQGMSNYAGDIIIEYKLTEDGIYRLQVFSKEEYDALSQDQITETGVGIIMVRDYNNAKELFKRKEEEESE